MKKILSILFLLIPLFAFSQAGVSMPGNPSPRYGFNGLYKFRSGVPHLVLDSGEVVALIGGGGSGGTVTSITPGYGFTSSTPITNSGTLTIDTSKMLTVLNLFPKSDTRYYTKTLADAKYLPLAGGTMTGTINSQSVIPKTTAAYDIGGSSLRFNVGYINLFYGNSIRFTGDFTVSNTSNTVIAKWFNATSNLVLDPSVTDNGQKLQVGGRIRATQGLTGTAGTDSLWVHDNTSKEFKLIGPAYYIPASGTSTVSGAKTFTAIQFFNASIAVGTTSSQQPVTYQGTSFTTALYATNPTAARVINLPDDNGTVMLVTSPSYNSTATQTTVTGSTSGSAIFSEPFAGTSYKKVIIRLATLNGTASYVFPTSFANTPIIVNTNSTSSAVITSLTTTGVTCTGSSTSGMLILEGY